MFTILLPCGIHSISIPLSLMGQLWHALAILSLTALVMHLPSSGPAWARSLFEARMEQRKTGWAIGCNVCGVELLDSSTKMSQIPMILF